MKFLSKTETDDITKLAYAGAFRFPYIEALDLVNAATINVFDKDKTYEGNAGKFTFDKDGTVYPIANGELYKQPLRYGVCATGTVKQFFQDLPITVSVFTDTKRLELSFNTKHAKNIVDENGELLTEDALIDLFLELISKIEIYGCIMSEQGYTMNAIKKQLDKYAKDPKENIVSRGPSWFNLDKIFHPAEETAEPQKEEKGENV